MKMYDRQLSDNGIHQQLTVVNKSFCCPISHLHMYESIILNRNLPITFNRWLKEEVTDLLSRYIGNEVITHLYAVKKFEFTEV